MTLLDTPRYIKRMKPYEPTQFDRDILKSPRYVGSITDLAPQIRQFSQPGLHYTLTKQNNTTITCTHCQGHKFHYVNHINGLVTKEPCPICNRTGTISNKHEEGEGR